MYAVSSGAAIMKESLLYHLEILNKIQNKNEITALYNSSNTSVSWIVIDRYTRKIFSKILAGL